jgi:hypothetical protein
MTVMSTQRAGSISEPPALLFFALFIEDYGVSGKFVFLPKN